MAYLLNYLRAVGSRQYVRPWALLTPILILLVCLPLLRPLRHPNPLLITDDEMARLATIQAVVEHGTLAIGRTQFAHTRSGIQVGSEIYSDQMPVMGVLLSGPYWVMHRFGLTFQENAVLVPYLLTLLGVTLPVAAGAGLIYRMGRIFELRRPWRAGLALGVAFASGLVSYAVVMNGYGPAGALVIAAAACLVHASMSKQPERTGAALALAGFCAALAAAIEIHAGIFALLLGGMILAMRWPVSLRVGGLLLYFIGMTPPLLLHAVLTMPVTGNLLPGFMHPELAVDRHVISYAASGAESIEARGSATAALVHRSGAMLGLLIGSRGMFSHFPVLVIGLLGIGAIMHRHWPASAKALASVTLAGGAVILLRLARPEFGAPPAFAMPLFVIFLPLILFWSGAWVRKPHHPAAWSAAALLLGFSVLVSVLGATGPYFFDETGGYTAWTAAKRLFTPDPGAAVLAGGVLP